MSMFHRTDMSASTHADQQQFKYPDSFDLLFRESPSFVVSQTFTNYT